MDGGKEMNIGGNNQRVRSDLGQNQQQGLTDADRRVLTEEVLKKCWHEVRGDAIPDDKDYALCIHCGIECSVEWSKCLSGEIPMDAVPADDILIATNNNTFATPDDLHAVYSALVEMGKWGEYIAWLVENGKTGDFKEYNGLSGPYKEHYLYPVGVRWLSCYGCPDQIPSRMKMVAEWWRSMKGGK
jgi:hypothetical protein